MRRFELKAQRGRALLLGAASTLALATPGVAAAAEFEGLGESTIAWAVSADGSTIVGDTLSPNGQEAFRFTENGGVELLGDLPGGTTTSTAWGVNADGSVIVGVGMNSGFQIEAFRWEAGAMTGLGINLGFLSSHALGVNADGSVIVGYQETASGTQHAFRWTQATGWAGLGGLTSPSSDSVARGVSADGAVIIGDAFDVALGRLEPFRWTQSDGMVGLGLLPNTVAGSATAISADGQVIVGYGTHPGGSTYVAFRWTEEDGLAELGFLDGHDTSTAHAVNADGSVIVGVSASNTTITAEAFYWTAADGMRAVSEILAADGVDVGAWRLHTATGVSGDGNIIVGVGNNPDGMTEAWWVRIASEPPSDPPPSDPPPDPPPPPPPPTGFLSSEVLARSVQSTAAVLSAAIAESNLDVLMRTSRSGGRDAAHDAADVGELRAWATGAARDYVGDASRADAGEANWLLSYQATPSLRFGGGVRTTSLDSDLSAFAGQAEYEAHALQAFAAYEPAESGLRVYLGAALGAGEASIDRGYLNGVTLVHSSGERDVSSIAAAGVVGWNIPVGASQLMPFVRYDAVQFKLDEYTETGGPFPIRFDEIDETIDITRVGVEGRASLSSAIEAQGAIAWGHRSDGHLPLITGEVVGMFNLYGIPSVDVEQDWTEASAALVWRARDGVNVRTGAAASTDGDTTPELSGFIGVDIRL